MLLPPPGRLSTTNCWPVRCVSHWLMMRARMSVVPAGVYGTIQRTGRFGYASAAHDDCATLNAPQQPSATDSTTFFIQRHSSHFLTVVCARGEVPERASSSRRFARARGVRKLWHSRKRVLRGLAECL